MVVNGLKLRQATTPFLESLLLAESGHTKFARAFPLDDMDQKIGHAASSSSIEDSVGGSSAHVGYENGNERRKLSFQY